MGPVTTETVTVKVCVAARRFEMLKEFDTTGSGLKRPEMSSTSHMPAIPRSPGSPT
jgi:hypothetical protein